MKDTLWNKRIPTLLGLALITFATILTSILVRQGTNLVGKAAPSNVPQNVRITNVTSTSFTVSYTTDAVVSGSISYGKNENLGQALLDERGPNSRKTHSIKVTNLSPSTKYLFSILSADEKFLNNGLPYEVTTGPNIIAKKPKAGFIVGKVVNLNGESISDGLVYVTIGKSQALSTVTKKDGTYSLSLEDTRSEDLASYSDFKDSRIKILILGPDGSSNVLALYKDVNSIPTIVLSKDYDFTEEEEVASVSAALENFPDFPKTKTKIVNPKITTPSENQILSDARPVFKGTGVPGSTIKIAVESEIQEAEILVDSSGNWTFKPSENLSPGQHKITISAKDAFGVLRTITLSFIIEVTQAQAATPSASPTSSPTPTPQPTATPTPLVGGPLLTPTPVPSALPEVGNPQIGTAIIGIAATLIGGLLFLLSRGAISF